MPPVYGERRCVEHFLDRRSDIAQADIHPRCPDTDLRRLPLLDPRHQTMTAESMM
jgi:hypothetical protein